MNKPPELTDKQYNEIRDRVKNRWFDGPVVDVPRLWFEEVWDELIKLGYIDGRRNNTDT